MKLGRSGVCLGNALDQVNDPTKNTDTVNNDKNQYKTVGKLLVGAILLVTLIIKIHLLSISILKIFCGIAHEVFLIYNIGGWIIDKQMGILKQQGKSEYQSSFKIIHSNIY